MGLEEQPSILCAEIWAEKLGHSPLGPALPLTLCDLEPVLPPLGFSVHSCKAQGQGSGLSKAIASQGMSNSGPRSQVLF